MAGDQPLSQLAPKMADDQPLAQLGPSLAQAQFQASQMQSAVWAPSAAPGQPPGFPSASYAPAPVAGNVQHAAQAQQHAARHAQQQLAAQPNAANNAVAVQLAAAAAAAAAVAASAACASQLPPFAQQQQHPPIAQQQHQQHQPIAQQQLQQQHQLQLQQRQQQLYAIGFEQMRMQPGLPQVGQPQPPAQASGFVFQPSSAMLAGAAASMHDGHVANQAGDFMAARTCFLTAYSMGGQAAAHISAANMAYKMRQLQVAAREYRDILAAHELAPTLRANIEVKLTTCIAGAVPGGAELRQQPKKPKQPKVPKQPRQPQLPGALERAPRPAPTPTGGPAHALRMQIQAPYAMRDAAGGLVIDKRGFALQVRATDAAGLPAQPIAVAVGLVFEDMSALPADVPSRGLVGTTHATPSGAAGVNMRLRMTATSKNVGRRRFRLLLEPADPALLASLPSLATASDPFTVVSATGVKKAAGADLLRASHAVLATKAHAAEKAVAAKLERRRYFSNADIAEATATPGHAGKAALSHGAVRLCDRLAALVTQQITQRAIAAARKRPPDVGSVEMPAAKRPAAGPAGYAAPPPALPYRPPPALPYSPSAPPPLPAMDGGVAPVRRPRCGTCPGCVNRDDCGLCINCLDKPKFGGPNTRKSACVHRCCSSLNTNKLGPKGWVPPTRSPAGSSPLGAASPFGAFDPRGVGAVAALAGGVKLEPAGLNQLLSHAAASPALGAASAAPAPSGTPDAATSIEPVWTQPAAPAVPAVGLPAPQQLQGVSVSAAGAPPSPPQPAPPPPPRMTRPRWALQAKDVVAAVKRPGNFDFLFHVNVVQRWEPPAPPAPAEAAAEGADDEMPTPQRGEGAQPERHGAEVASASPMAVDAPEATVAVSAPPALQPE